MFESYLAEKNDDKHRSGEKCEREDRHFIVFYIFGYFFSVDLHRCVHPVLLLIRTEMRIYQHLILHPQRKYVKEKTFIFFKEIVLQIQCICGII